MLGNHEINKQKGLYHSGPWQETAGTIWRQFKSLTKGPCSRMLAGSRESKQLRKHPGAAPTLRNERARGQLWEEPRRTGLLGQACGLPCKMATTAPHIWSQGRKHQALSPLALWSPPTGWSCLEARRKGSLLMRSTDALGHREGWRRQREDLER